LIGCGQCINGFILAKYHQFQLAIQMCAATSLSEEDTVFGGMRAILATMVSMSVTLIWRLRLLPALKPLTMHRLHQ
jgi:hypothetical protein